MNKTQLNHHLPILHVDINSYFATLLQQENPTLRGKPVGVLKDDGRSCVIAASKEAKTFGVKTGMALVDARQRCPDIITVPAQFDHALAATKKLKALFHTIAPQVEIFSLDEAFIDLSDCLERLYHSPHQAAALIQHKIATELGSWVTANVGISYTRLLAKLASETAPPNSITTINQTNCDSALASAKFSDICGIGHRLEKKLALIGVTNPYQLRFFSETELTQLVGPFWSRELLQMAYGQDSPSLRRIDQPLPHMKSVGRSLTGFKPYRTDEELSTIIYNLIEEVTYKTRRMNLAGRYVWIKLYGHNYSWNFHRTLKHHINTTQEMFELLYLQGYLKAHHLKKRTSPIIKCAVRLGMLQPSSTLTPSLLPRDQKWQAVAQASDSISNRYGLFTLHSGRLLNKKIVKAEVTGFLGDKIYHLQST